MAFGKRLCKARKAADLSQEALAKILGVKKGAVSNWERASNDPTLKNIREIARALSVTVAWLVDEEGEGPVPRVHRRALEISRQLGADERADWFQVGNTILKSQSRAAQAGKTA